ncbi:hypothetical protein [Tessaracoccus terricola]
MTLDDDVARELERLRRDEGLGLSTALNQLVRRGMAARDTPPVDYVHMTEDLQIQVDISNVGEVLDILDEADRVE